MLMRPPEGLFAPPMDVSPKHSPKLMLRHSGRGIHPQTAGRKSVGGSSDDESSVDTSYIAQRKPSEPALSHEQWNPDGTMGGYVGPPAVSAPTSHLARRRDSAAAAFTGGESFMHRFKKSLGNNSTASHRRLSVALNPQQQYGRTSALELQQSASVVSQGSTFSAHAPRLSSTDSKRVVGVQLRGNSILNNPLTNTAPLVPSSSSQLFGDSLAQDSMMSLEQPSTSMLNESSTATADFASFTTSVDNTADNTSNTSHAGSHVEAEVPAKIVVDSLIVLAQAQVIIGKHTVWFNSFMIEILLTNRSNCNYRCMQ